ncbi:unnamed protein product [Trypanosoma congolense IL3000]|uniref:WGS project CAEQ00000000 data, annotated contig 1634 n=1 Tax=Trypanosoma congolense (strain IL3000) TaxID=1068625 RepID=F9W7N1_TRYCI|nr:unnamed protein product [Trypanosoma congolense IL3000]
MCLHHLPRTRRFSQTKCLSSRLTWPASWCPSSACRTSGTRRLQHTRSSSRLNTASLTSRPLCPPLFSAATSSGASSTTMHFAEPGNTMCLVGHASVPHCSRHRTIPSQFACSPHTTPPLIRLYCEFREFSALVYLNHVPHHVDICLEQLLAHPACKQSPRIQCVVAVHGQQVAHGRVSDSKHAVA